MNPTRSTNVRRHEDSRCRNEDHDANSVLRSRTEEEKQRRRREWQRQQERERQHERLKQQKILEYERKRAQALGYPEPKSSYRSRSKSSSKSPSRYRHREQSTISASKPCTLFEKSDGSASGAGPLFKGPEGIQISTTELRRIKVDIHRNIPIKGPISELQRSILDPEDVVLKRREGEGSKPIFDREEIKKADNINEVEERRTVVAISGEQSGSTSKLQTSKKHSSSLSPIYSGYLSSHSSRYRTDSKHQDNRTEFRDHHKNNGSSIEKHREYKEKYIERDPHKYKTDRSRSRERDSRKSHSRSLMEERSYRDRYRDRSNERSRERRDRDRDKDRDRDRSRERRDVAPHYIEPPIHVPIYYNLPPRPIVVSPMVPFPRGQVPPMGRGRHSLMAPVRPFPPRFIPPDIYRLGPPPPNPRYGPF
ncbi:feminizer isoform X2 [Anoplolepis gracilipes]|uniref:feminizer isoform X2 n=1 Tax=Anoplolepis gracilipes TaxID=354296 RepID=UPI003B9E0262